MKYKKIKKDNYNIHIIDDKRFHTIIFKVFFTENVTYEKITSHNFITNLLLYASNKYDTKSKLLRKSQDIYSMYPYASSVRLGNLLITKFTLCMVNSVYIDENYLKENLLLLKEIILNPLIEDNAFSSKYFEIVKNEEINEIKVQYEDPRTYANMHLLDMLEKDKTMKYNLTSFSKLDVIEKLNPQNLYQDYLEMLNNSKIDIFVSGNITNENELVKNIVNNFNFPNNHYNLDLPYIRHFRKNRNIKLKKETLHYNQSKISMAIKAYDLNRREIKYILPVFSNILGGGFNSLLMQEVRENNSLAYYISSYYNKLDSLIVLNSGINKDNYEKVIKLIKDTLENIKNGNFDISYLRENVMDYISEIESLNDNNNSLIEYYYGIELFKSESVEDKIKIVKKITKNDIVKIAKKVRIDSIFYLEGDL